MHYPSFKSSPDRCFPNVKKFLKVKMSITATVHNQMLRESLCFNLSSQSPSVCHVRRLRHSQVTYPVSTGLCRTMSPVVASLWTGLVSIMGCGDAGLELFGFLRVPKSQTSEQQLRQQWCHLLDNIK